MNQNVQKFPYNIYHENTTSTMRRNSRRHDKSSSRYTKLIKIFGKIQIKISWTSDPKETSSSTHKDWYEECNSRLTQLIDQIIEKFKISNFMKILFRLELFHADRQTRKILYSLSTINEDKLRKYQMYKII